MQSKAVRKRRKFHNWSIYLALCLIIAGCDLINPSDPVPGYVYFDDIELKVQPGEGTALELITEGWFYAGGDFLGAYAMPAKVPVIAQGPTEILVFPGIKVNGISFTPDIYPFLQRYEVTVDLQPAKTDTIYPETQYADLTMFPLLEDFETSNLLADDLDGDLATNVQVTTEGVLEGSRSGLIILNAEAPLIEVASIPQLTNLPTNNSPAFVELNYRNNVEFAVGLVGEASGIGQVNNVILFVRTREEWSKIYVELTPALFASQLDAYQLLITAVHDPELEQSEIYLDNIKIVHF